MDDSKATAAPSAVSCLQIAVTRGAGLIEGGVNLWLVPGFSQTHEVQFFFPDVVFYQGRFVVHGLSIEKLKFKQRLWGESLQRSENTVVHST